MCLSLNDETKIIIEDLEIFANHGLYDEELNGQLFNLSFVLKGNFKKAAELDDINLTINYDEFCGFANQTFKKKRFKLLESAIYFLAKQLILKFDQIKGIKIIAYKKNAPLKSKASLKCAKIELALNWHTAFIGLGSNLGNKLKNIETAINKLKNSEGVKLKKVSTIIETEAYGRKMDNFLNCVVEIETFLNPFQLLRLTSSIEVELKRTREIKWGPRTIDLDILFFDDLVLTTTELTIPHYDIKNRDFVLKPMAELCPNLIHPVINKSMIDLAKANKKLN